MAKSGDPPEGTLSINFDKITAVFTALKPVVKQCANIEEFVATVQPVAQKMILKYFEFPGSRMYKLEDLSFVVEHLTNCINNIMPKHIPFVLIVEAGQWRFYQKKEDDLKPPKPS